MTEIANCKGLICMQGGPSARNDDFHTRPPDVRARVWGNDNSKITGLND